MRGNAAAAEHNLFYVKFRFILTITWASRDEFPRKILPILEFGVSIFGANLKLGWVWNLNPIQVLLRHYPILIFKSSWKTPNSLLVLATFQKPNVKTMTESKHLSVQFQLQISFFKIQGEGGTVYRVDEIRFLIGKQCSILLLFALVLCVQKLEKLHNGTFLANWANPTWFQKDSQFDCFIVTFRVLHVSVLYTTFFSYFFS